MDGVTVGCCGFEHHVDFQDGQENENPTLRGSLYISTTGVLPRFQGKGFGPILSLGKLHTPVATDLMV